MSVWRLLILISLATLARVGPASAQQLNADQINFIKQTAADLCSTVKEAKGQKTDAEIKGDIQAKLKGLAGKLADLGGGVQGSIKSSEFEGLTQDATAIAMQGDRECRERLFNKMFDKIGSADAPAKISYAKYMIPKSNPVETLLEIGISNPSQNSFSVENVHIGMAKRVYYSCFTGSQWQSVTLPTKLGFDKSGTPKAAASTVYEGKSISVEYRFRGGCSDGYERFVADIPVGLDIKPKENGRVFLSIISQQYADMIRENLIESYVSLNSSDAKSAVGMPIKSSQ